MRLDREIEGKGAEYLFVLLTRTYRCWLVATINHHFCKWWTYPSRMCGCYEPSKDSSAALFPRFTSSFLLDINIDIHGGARSRSISEEERQTCSTSTRTKENMKPKDLGERIRMRAFGWCKLYIHSQYYTVLAPSFECNSIFVDRTCPMSLYSESLFFLLSKYQHLSHIIAICQLSSNMQRKGQLTKYH